MEKAADRGNVRADLQDYSCDLMIDPTATGTVK